MPALQYPPFTVSAPGVSLSIFHSGSPCFNSVPFFSVQSYGTRPCSGVMASPAAVWFHTLSSITSTEPSPQRSAGRSVLAGVTVSVFTLPSASVRCTLVRFSGSISYPRVAGVPSAVPLRLVTMSNGIGALMVTLLNVMLACTPAATCRP